VSDPIARAKALLRVLSEAPTLDAAVELAALVRAHRLRVVGPFVRHVAVDVAAENIPPRTLITSLYGGECCLCGDSYDVGEVVAWSRKHKTAHVDCARNDNAAIGEHVQ
jgi:hypothetical protein